MNTYAAQRTILGPLFFILYVNDLLRGMPKDTVMSYADDTWTSVQDKMNAYLQHMSNWLALNKLSLNIQKSMYITFGNYCNSVPDTLNIKIKNQQTKRVHSYKYLGIYFDFDMKWNRHTEYIINKIKYLLFIFAKLKKCMETKTLMIMYYACFHSLINYRIIAWGGAYKNKLHLLQQVQTRLKNSKKKTLLMNAKPH